MYKTSNARIEFMPVSDTDVDDSKGTRSVTSDSLNDMLDGSDKPPVMKKKKTEKK